MKLLALDCSSKTASAALVDGGRLLGQVFLNAGLTHSETLLPMISSLLTQTRTTADWFDAIAVTRGPGSFTGLRIGISTVVGLAWAKSLPCLGVSSLEAAARNVAHDTAICAVMDARRGRVYHALFAASPFTRLTEDRTVALETLELPENCVLVGDGAALCHQALCPDGGPAVLAPPHLRYPTGYGVALAALAAGDGAFHGADTLRAAYYSDTEHYQRYSLPESTK